MFLPLLISISAMACKSEDLVPLIIAPTKSYQLEVDRHQEVILDGGAQLPKITGIQGSTLKGKPMLSVMSGLQVLEKGEMKSYPHRISVKMNEAETDWDRPVEIKVSYQDKPFVIAMKWKQAKSGCSKPSVK